MPRTTRLTRWIVSGFVALISSGATAASNLGYDPKADPFQQYHEAVAIAERDSKLVLIIAGGDWCSWCHVLDRFVAGDPEIDARLHDAFVVMKVYVGFDNYNHTFFSQLPVAKGAPHFWIVSPDKEVLSSQSTGGFEAGKSGYDRQAFLQFIHEWKARGVVFSQSEQPAEAQFAEEANRSAGT